MDKQRIRVVNPNGGWLGTEYYINGQKINGVKSVDFRVAVDEVPIFQFETMGMPDIDMKGDVKFSFTPETVQEAAIVLRDEFMHNLESRQALIASIESVLREESSEYLVNGLAKKIADRIIGMGRE